MTYESDGGFVGDGWYGNVDAYSDCGIDFDGNETMIVVMEVTTMTDDGGGNKDDNDNEF